MCHSKGKMASNLLKNAILSNQPSVKKTLGIIFNATRNYNNYEYQPGQYPKTPEAREAAAKRYGMSIEEYQPYPEHMGYGDYPKLPDIGEDSKDPYYPYDNPELKRNFNEPMNARMEIFGSDRYDPSMKRRFSLLHQWAWFLGAVGGSMLLFFYLENYKIGRPVTAKQYPYNGPHFMFGEQAHK